MSLVKKEKRVYNANFFPLFITNRYLSEDTPISSLYALPVDVSVSQKQFKRVHFILTQSYAEVNPSIVIKIPRGLEYIDTTINDKDKFDTTYEDDKFDTSVEYAIVRNYRIDLKWSSSPEEAIEEGQYPFYFEDTIQRTLSETGKALTHEFIRFDTVVPTKERYDNITSDTDIRSDYFRAVTEDQRVEYTRENSGAGDYQITADADTNLAELRDEFDHFGDLDLMERFTGEEPPSYGSLDASNVTVTLNAEEFDYPHTIPYKFPDTLNFWHTNDLDASTTCVLRSQDVVDDDPYNLDGQSDHPFNSNYSFNNEYYDASLYIDKLPVGNITTEFYDSNDDLAFVSYNSLGYFTPKNLYTDSADPISASFGLLGAYVNGFPSYLIQQAFQYLSLQNSYKKQDIISGLPNNLSRVINKDIRERKDRSTFHNLFYTLFLMSTINSYKEENNRNWRKNLKFSEELLDAVEDNIELFANSLFISSKLITKRFNSVGFPSYDFSLISNLMYLLVTGKFLNLRYNERIHKTAVEIWDTVYHLATNFEGQWDEDPELLNLIILWFAHYFGDEVLEEDAITRINNDSDFSDKPNYIQALLHYTSQFVEGLQDPRFSDDLTEVLAGVYEYQGDYCLYFSSTQKAIDEEFWVLDGKPFYLDVAEIKLNLSIYEEQSRNSIPIGDSWFSEEEVERGVIGNMIESFLYPSLTSELKRIRSERVKGKSLDRLLAKYDLEREPFISDQYLRDLLDIELSNRGSKEREIKNWIQEQISAEVRFNEIPEQVIDNNNSLVKWQTLSELKEYVYEEDGEYFLDTREDGEEKQLPWSDLVGNIKVRSKDYYGELFRRLKKLVPGGVKLKVEYDMELG